MVPALLLPVTPGLLVDELDALQPLRALHAVMAWNQDARGEAVIHRERGAVELVRDEDFRRALDQFVGQALRVSVARPKRDPGSPRLR